MKSIDKTVKRLTEKLNLDSEDSEMLSQMLYSVVDSREKRIKSLEKKLEKHEKAFVPTKKKIMGSLKNCIDAHGPITKDLLESAAKRVLNNCFE